MDYIVLGLTAGMSSAELIGRYKSEWELRDVLRGDLGVARKASRRHELYVFEECRVRDTCLYLITFDIRVKRGARRPSHEYSDIKEALLSRFCGSVDLSTYVCPENEVGDVERYLREAGLSYRVAYYYVRPWRREDAELVAEAMQETLEWLSAKASATATLVANVAPQGYGQVRKKALGFLEGLREAEELARRAEAKLRSLGIEVPLLQAVLEAERQVREALERREEARAQTRRHHPRSVF